MSNFPPGFKPIAKNDWREVYEYVETQMPGAIKLLGENKINGTLLLGISNDELYLVPSQQPVFLDGQFQGEAAVSHVEALIRNLGTKVE